MSDPRTAIDYDGNYGPDMPDDDRPDPYDYLPDDDEGDGDDDE